MLRRFLPKQANFFKLFQQIADLLVKTLADFNLMLYSTEDRQAFVDRIQAFEQEADTIVHCAFALLHKTFITPFDRHDIHKLTNGLDDIIDLINRSSQRFPFYHLKNLPNEIYELAKLGQEASILLQQAIYRLHTLNKSTEILSYCLEIDTIESKAHRLLLAGEKNLFLVENDFKHFLKLKEIYNQLKLVIDHCQDVANLIKGIVLEYS